MILRLVWLNLGSESILNRDEAALAYNALLLRESGKDEWGRSWPLALESFGDYKLLGYPLSLVPLFTLFGYSDAIVRLPSALAGGLLIVVSYYLADSFNLSKKWRVLYAFLIATSPVFFFYSRLAFEANVALVLFVLFLAVGLKARENKWLQLVSGLLLFMACGTYNTPLLYVPFITILLIFWYGVKLWKAWLPIVIMCGFIAFFFFVTLAPLTAQKSSITIFNDELVWAKSVEYRLSLPSYLQSTLGSKYVYYMQLLIKATMASFSPSFVTIRGGTHPWHTLPNWGNIVWPVYIFSLLGTAIVVVYVLKKMIGNDFKEAAKCKQELFLVALLFMSLFPSVITVDTPHTTRSLFFFVVLLLIGVKGISIVVKKYEKKRAVSFVGYLFIISSTIFFGVYVSTYFARYPEQMRILYQGGISSALTKTETASDAQVAIIDGGGYHYIIVAWYLKLDPNTFFTTVVKQNPDKIGFRYGEKLGKYHFIAQESDRSNVEKMLLTWEDNTWKVKE